MRRIVLAGLLATASLSHASDPSWLITQARRDLEDGRTARAWSKYERAEQESLRRGDRGTWITARCQRTELALLAGDLAVADSLRPHFTRLEETRPDSARIRLSAARGLVAQGHAALAQDEAWKARLAARASGEDALEAAAWLVLSRCESLLGKAEEARQSIGQARDLADGEAHLEAQADLEESRGTSTDPNKALRLCRRAKEGFRAAHWPTGVLLSLRREAELLDASGRSAEAADARSEASDLAVRIGLR